MVYLRLLRVPHLGPLLAVAVLGRLPVAVNPLAIILFVRDERGDFGSAGVVAGALALGSALAAPVVGRWVDRAGLRLLVPIGVVHAAGLGVLVVLTFGTGPVWLLCLVAFVAGGMVPPVSSVLRVLYPRLLGQHTGELLPAAYALDTVATDLLFAGGPLVVAAIVALAAPEDALIVSAAAVVVGNAAFVALVPGPLRLRGRLAGDGGVRRRLGALASPGIRVLTFTMLPLGIGFGILEVVIPAFARREGVTEAAGPLLAVWSIASAAGGLWYGIAARARDATREGAFVVVLALATAPLLLASSPWVMALLLIPAGLPIGPIIAVRNQLAGAVAPRGAETEAYTWVLTAMVAGIAFGAGIGGVLIDVGGWRAATAAAVASAVLGAAGALAGARTLRADVAAAAAA